MRRHILQPRSNAATTEMARNDKRTAIEDSLSLVFEVFELGALESTLLWIVEVEKSKLQRERKGRSFRA